MSENVTHRGSMVRFLGAGVATVIAAVVANLIVRALLFALIDLPADFPPLQALRVAFLTVLGVGAAAVVFAVIARRSERPARTFRRVAVVAFLLSIVPNLALAINPSAAPFANASAMGFLILIVFHVVAAVITVLMLPRLT
ncbi:MAG: DUF6069 family protein [Candidatus Promineifilaceae bacterium]|nr:DUF6069 family protein [Candidatus Promineifilaceae bacterium]